MSDTLDVSPDIHSLLDRYDAEIGDRDRSFWAWLDELLPGVTLSCVDVERFDDVQRAKLLASIIVTVLDDAAEKHDDRATWREAAKVPFSHESPDTERDGVDANVVEYVKIVWDTFETVPLGPRVAEFSDIFMFDLRQVFVSIEYSYLTNNHLDAVNESELMDYDAHNMAVIVFADIDLMASPTFDSAELPALREAIRRAERTARIANWIATWERELGEGDCISGVVARALREGIVSSQDLEAIRENPTDDIVEPVIRAIRDHDTESDVWAWADAEFFAARSWASEIESVDVGAYIDGFENVTEAYRDLERDR